MKKKRYFIIWVEGLEYKTGEKIKCFTDTGYDYTLLMTEALRVKEEDITKVKHYLKRHGVSQWVLDSPNTFIPTSYAPKGTIFNPKYEHIAY